MNMTGVDIPRLAIDRFRIVCLPAEMVGFSQPFASSYANPSPGAASIRCFAACERMPGAVERVSASRFLSVPH